MINLSPFMVSAFGIMLIKLFSSPRLHKCVSTFYFSVHFIHLNLYLGTSLVVQWLRVCLTMQGTQGTPGSIPGPERSHMPLSN